MKTGFKNTIVLLLITSIIIVLASCGSSQNANNTQQDNSGNPNGGLSQSRPDLYGEVKSISGNNVTIALIDMSQMQNRQRPSGQWPSGTRPSGVRPSGTHPSGPWPSGTRPSGVRPSGTRPTPNYTGKTETITVSSDTSITTTNRSNGNFQEVQLKLSGIKVGTFIQVWFKQDSAELIQTIRVMQQGGFSRQQGDNPPQQQDNSSPQQPG